MKSKEEIRKLAWNKFEAAICLNENDFADEAFYLGGFVVELLLKAAICKAMDLDDFLDERGKWLKDLRYPQTFKTHNIDQLIILSGLQNLLSEECLKADFDFHWNSACKWTVEWRYSRGKDFEQVDTFLKSVKEVAKWIETQL